SHSGLPHRFFCERNLPRSILHSPLAVFLFQPRFGAYTIPSRREGYAAACLPASSQIKTLKASRTLLLCPVLPFISLPSPLRLHSTLSTFQHGRLTPARSSSAGLRQGLCRRSLPYSYRRRWCTVYTAGKLATEARPGTAAVSAGRGSRQLHVSTPSHRSVWLATVLLYFLVL
uniref:Uncharacterized protein n=1 Tax=Aegilops tauschii subsp. strangulata TaxID=200361 RepID=A0A453CUK3_AEGTS